MRTYVTFQCPVALVAVSESDGILSATGAQWFADILRRVPALEIDEHLCQEDWGVALFARRDGKKFWIGLSAWKAESSWLAHFHHGSFALIQRYLPSAENVLKALLVDVHEQLTNDASISEIEWREEAEIAKPKASGYHHPIAT